MVKQNSKSTKEYHLFNLARLKRKEEKSNQSINLFFFEQTSINLLKKKNKTFWFLFSSSAQCTHGDICHLGNEVVWQKREEQWDRERESVREGDGSKLVHCILDGTQGQNKHQL